MKLQWLLFSELVVSLSSNSPLVLARKTNNTPNQELMNIDFTAGSVSSGSMGAGNSYQKINGSSGLFSDKRTVFPQNYGKGISSDVQNSTENLLSMDFEEMVSSPYPVNENAFDSAKLVLQDSTPEKRKRSKSLEVGSRLAKHPRTH